MSHQDPQAPCGCGPEFEKFATDAAQNWGSGPLELLRQFAPLPVGNGTILTLLDVRFPYPVALTLDCESIPSNPGTFGVPDFRMTVGAGNAAMVELPAPLGRSTLITSRLTVTARLVLLQDVVGAVGPRVSAFAGLWAADDHDDASRGVELGVSTPPGPGVGVEFVLLPDSPSHDRRAVDIQNDSSAGVELCFSRAGIPFNVQRVLNPGDTFRTPEVDRWTGIVRGRWQAAGAGTLRGIGWLARGF